MEEEDIVMDSRLNMKNLSLCWAAPRASDAINLLDRFNLALIVCCDHSQTAEAINSRRRIPVISYERKLQCRRRMSISMINHAFGEMFASQEFLSAARESAPLTIMPYGVFPSLEQAAKDGQWRMLAPDAALRNSLDDKRHARAIFQSLNVPLVACRQMMFCDLEAELRRSPPETPLVVKYPFSDSGSQIYLVNGTDDLSQIAEEAKTGEIDLLVEPFLDSYSLNTNAVATPQGTILAPASLQIIGASDYARNPFKFCGNDFASAALAPDAVRQKCYDITDRLGELLVRRGYLGVFGVDFIADSQGEVYPVEINPRFQNSTPLVDTLMAEAGLPTLAELHALAYLGGEEELRRRVGLLCDPPAASQLVVYNRSEPPFVKITGAVREGIYRWDDESRKLEYRRGALSIKECSGDEIFIGSGLPPSGFKVERAAKLCRVQSRQRFLSDDLRRLRPSIANCALALETDLALETVE
ncbi:MAG: ATP-grasp domain-containing protein [Blastocatellia bacterium]